MGTFSKTLGVVGGFVCASKSIIDYLRYFARSYMFSASLPPIVVAAALAGLDVIQQNPELITQLHCNVKYAVDGLSKIGLAVDPEAAIIALRVPDTMNIRKAVYRFHELGIFINSVEYPAVPVTQQRFRISLMATHTREDLDRLVEGIADVWQNLNNSEELNKKAA
jgi:glycine C-acetyltransferase